jgi:hypothetical protein
LFGYQRKDFLGTLDVCLLFASYYLAGSLLAFKAVFKVPYPCPWVIFPWTNLKILVRAKRSAIVTKQIKDVLKVKNLKR